MGVRELAVAVGLHANTAREHLDRLVEGGLVERAPAPPNGRGRPQLRYRARPEGAAEDPNAYRALAAVLAEELAALPDPQAAAIEAGERWGRTLAHGGASGATPAALDPVHRVVDLLDDAGFAPERPVVPDEPIRLRRCPFGSLARQRGDVVCAVHLGLLRGALRELDAPFDAVGLEPFVTPDLCLAHLGDRAAMPSPPSNRPSPRSSPTVREDSIDG